MYFVKALKNGEYMRDFVNRYPLNGLDVLDRALHVLRNGEYMVACAWDQLRVEDANGRIVARKLRWEAVEAWCEGRWVQESSHVG